VSDERGTLHLFSLTVQNGSFVATNSTGTIFTNPFNHRVHSSMPACSLGTCPSTINALLCPCVPVSLCHRVGRIFHRAIQLHPLAPFRSTRACVIASEQ
jgi:hypothetical protein